jgi:4-hydroxy-4-methyl-2-oxoglutarate aldolase
MDEAWLSSALASDAATGRGVLPGFIRPLKPGPRLVGAVTTCTVRLDDNLSVRQAIVTGPQTGAILVVGGAGESKTAIMGDLVAEALSMRGFLGVVTDGLVRDSGQVTDHLKVWCRGVTPTAGAKKGPAVVGETVTIGGVEVAPGDLIVCDDDGVVVWPAAAVSRLRASARERDARDVARGVLLRRTGRLDD